MGAKRLARRKKIKPFIKVVNYSHLFPTRYSVELEGLKGIVSSETFKEPSQREDSKKQVKKLLEERFTNGKNKWFFQSLRVCGHLVHSYPYQRYPVLISTPRRPTMHRQRSKTSMLFFLCKSISNVLLRHYLHFFPAVLCSRTVVSLCNDDLFGLIHHTCNDYSLDAQAQCGDSALVFVPCHPVRGASVSFRLYPPAARTDGQRKRGLS
jgi:hypothetical protein